MSGKATKSPNNAYYAARIEASAFNDRLKSRESAADEVCIDRTRLAHIEIGDTNPHPEDVVLMADVYNAPQLLNYFCAHQCPIGCGRVDELNPRNLESVAIRIDRYGHEFQNLTHALLEIAEDGVVDEAERKTFDAVVDRLRGIRKSIDELLLLADKAESPKGGAKR